VNKKTEDLFEWEDIKTPRGNLRQKILKKEQPWFSGITAPEKRKKNKHITRKKNIDSNVNVFVKLINKQPKNVVEIATHI